MCARMRMGDWLMHSRCLGFFFGVDMNGMRGDGMVVT